MIIIVEGPDGSGKDTFINNLEKLTDMRHVRGSSFEISQSGSKEMYRKWKDMLLKDNNIIINRFIYSNLVYGPMYNFPTITKNLADKIQEIVNERAVVVYINTDTDIIVDRIKSRGDEDIHSRDIKSIQLGYSELWSKYKPINFVEIDSGSNELLDINSETYKNLISKLNLKKGDSSG